MSGLVIMFHAGSCDCLSKGCHRLMIFRVMKPARKVLNNKINFKKILITCVLY